MRPSPAKPCQLAARITNLMPTGSRPPDPPLLMSTLPHPPLYPLQLINIDNGAV
jgi:hypothetical protein